jgi:dUTP pyrophosphatase
MQEIPVPTILENEEYLPVYGSELAAGADVRAYIESPIILEPGTSLLIPTGLKFAIPEGYEIQVRPRSGLALKHQITVLNTPGTIDADYRGEVGVILINHGKEPFLVTPGMRIAQLVLAPVIKARFIREEMLAVTLRGEGGFGHTGTH